MANDLLCWNITKDEIKVRQVVVNDAVWPAQRPFPPSVPPDPSKAEQVSQFIGDGRTIKLNDEAGHPDVKAFEKKYGTSDKPNK